MDSKECLEENDELKSVPHPLTRSKTVIEGVFTEEGRTTLKSSKTSSNLKLRVSANADGDIKLSSKQSSGERKQGSLKKGLSLPRLKTTEDQPKNEEKKRHHDEKRKKKEKDKDHREKKEKKEKHKTEEDGEGGSSNSEPSRRKKGRDRVNSRTDSPGLNFGSSGSFYIAPQETNGNERETQLFNVLSEILYTEQNFVKDMDTIVLFYYAPMVKKEELKAFIPDIFSNILKLREAARKQLHLFETIMSDVVLENFVMPHIGRGFLAIDESVYTDYCQNQNVCHEAVALLERIPELKQFFEQHRWNNMDLNSQLIKPVQKLCKYPLLLKEILKHLPEDDPECKNVEAALTKIEGMLDRINKSVEQQKTIEVIKKAMIGESLDLSAIRTIYEALANQKVVSDQTLDFWEKKKREPSHTVFMTSSVYFVLKGKQYFYRFSELNVKFLSGNDLDNIPAKSSGLKIKTKTGETFIVLEKTYMDALRVYTNLGATDKDATIAYINKSLMLENKTFKQVLSENKFIDDAILETIPEDSRLEDRDEIERKEKKRQAQEQAHLSSAKSFAALSCDGVPGPSFSFFKNASMPTKPAPIHEKLPTLKDLSDDSSSEKLGKQQVCGSVSPPDKSPNNLSSESLADIMPPPGNPILPPSSSPPPDIVPPAGPPILPPPLQKEETKPKRGVFAALSLD